MQAKCLLLLLPALAMASCNQSNRSAFEEHVNPADRICNGEIERANRDIARNNIVHCHYVGNLGVHLLTAEAEMKSLLSRYDVLYQNEYTEDALEENGNYNCYCKTMEDKIAEKFGPKFIDSLLHVADSLYAVGHPDVPGIAKHN